MSDPSTPRTRLGLLAEILAEAAGRPVEQVAGLLADFQAVGPGVARDGPLSEAEYLALRDGMRAELPGIRAWLAKGAARADPARIDELWFRARHRN